METPFREGGRQEEAVPSPGRLSQVPSQALFQLSLASPTPLPSPAEALRLSADLSCFLLLLISYAQKSLGESTTRRRRTLESLILLSRKCLVTQQWAVSIADPRGLSACASVLQQLGFSRSMQVWTSGRGGPVDSLRNALRS